MNLIELYRISIFFRDIYISLRVSFYCEEGRRNNGSFRWYKAESSWKNAV